MYNAKAFLEAIDELEVSKSISKLSIISALKEALEKGLKKQLGGDDALVSVNIDVDTGMIDMAQIKIVVEEVEDDFLQISLEDARAVNPDLNIGDEFHIPSSVENIMKSTALAIKSVLKQKLAEAEKEALYDAYQDKIGEMITGVVEKVEERGIYVNIARTTVFVSKRQLIGDERFEPKDTIRLYVSDVTSGPKGARIEVSRANEGFLNRIFEEEIHEVYDGTIIIKGIARKAGERSKVAVYSNDPNVDPAGACIGPNGTRIQKVVGQLGNGSTKEKVDVIGYNENPGLFIIEALKPAQVLGVDVNKETKEALAVVNNDTLSLAYGRKWVNVRLAEQLTGYHIDIKELDVALGEGRTYQTVEELERIEIEEKQRAAQAALEEQQRLERLRASIPEGYVAPTDRVYEDEEVNEEEQAMLEEQLDRELESSVDDVMPVKEEKVEAAPVEVAPVVEEKAAKTVKQDIVEETVKEEKPVEPTTKVKTTTTLEALESALADEAKKAKTSGTKYRRKKKEEKVEEEVTIKSVEPEQRMDIYTKEELEELEKEDAQEAFDDFDDDIDYDDYDDYYDDDNN